MLKFLRENPKYFIGAVIVHLFFLVLFGIGFHFKSDNRASTTVPQTVKVKTVDERLVKKELKKFKDAEKREKQKQQEIVKKRKQEERKLEALRKERIAKEKEKKRLAMLEEKKRQEKKQREERLRKEKLQREKELKQKLQAEQERMQAEEQERLRKEQEIAALRAAELKKKQTMIDKYMNLIEAKVYQKWIRPPGDLKGKVCELQVRLIPSGDVIHIELSKSSGDPEYDKSVQAAVKSASPLPLPPAETGLFEVFRDLRLPMRADKKT